MGILDALKGIFGGKGGGGSDPSGRYFYIRCNACGEAIRVRVSMTHDLSQEFDGGDNPSGYIVNKDVMGSACFKVMHLTVQFDGGRRVTEQKVTEATLISREEYEQSLG